MKNFFVSSITKVKIILLFLLFSYVMSGNIIAKEPATIFFYNPDANIENLELLVRTFSAYFQDELSDFKMQPFVNVETLVNISLQRSPGFLIIPYWNYKLLSKDQAFASAKVEGVLTPMSSSSLYFKKLVLIGANSPFSDVSSLEGRIASTSLGLQSVDFLDEFLFKERVEFSNLQFTWTRKDMDSLLALRFNQVQIAIINDKTYDETKESQPQMVAGMKILEESEPIPEVVLVKLGNNVDDETGSQMNNLFLNMHNSDNGKAILNLLGYEKWLEFSK
jgi:hypothetical protein